MVLLLRKGKHVGWRRHVSLSIDMASLRSTSKQQKVRPDFVFKQARVALFIDGCFWHRCPLHFKLPSANQDYWEQKIERNVSRDRRTAAGLRRTGWKVVRIWEHELRSPDRVARRLERLLPRAAA